VIAFSAGRIASFEAIVQRFFARTLNPKTL
jgi:hypothetical protein